MTDNGDICKYCGKPQMPKWSSEIVKARACQSCGEVEERSGESPIVCDRTSKAPSRPIAGVQPGGSVNL